MRTNSLIIMSISHSFVEGKGEDRARDYNGRGKENDLRYSSLCPELDKNGTGKKTSKTSRNLTELILAIVPFGQINSRMLELEKPMIYGL